MTDYREITKIFTDQFLKIGFQKPVVFFKDSKNLEQFIYLGNYHGKLALIKLYSTKNREKSSNLFREYNITKLLKKRVDDKKIPLNFISVLEAGSFEGYNWLIREYIPGKSLGDDAKNHQQPLYLDSYSFIKKEFEQLDDDLLDKIVKEIQLFQQIEFTNSEFDEFDCRQRFDFSNVSESDLKAVSEGVDFGLGKQREKINSAPSKKQTVLTISDFAPGNILVSKKNQIFISDFEWLVKDNYLFDFTFLWLYLWRYPVWQEGLIKRVIKNQIDQKLFVSNLIKIILVTYPAVFSTKKNNQVYISGYKNHIWTRYLQAAGESFEAIMEIK